MEKSRQPWEGCRIWLSQHNPEFLCCVSSPAPDFPQVEEIISEDTVDVTTEATMPEAAPDVKVTEESSVHSSSAKAPRSSSPKLSYGTWTGGWKNGNPHGTGTLTYSVSKTIDSRDSKGRIAKPGEYIVGEWDNGHLVQGRWFKKDGTKEVIIIGKVD